MVNVLIPTMIGDTDGIFVQVGLEEKGAKAIRWIGELFPREQVSSFRVSNSKPAEAFLKAGGSSIKLAVDVVWLRRPRFPILPPGIDPRDKEIALEENRAYMSSLFESMTDSAVWVNSLAGRRRANSKLSQLKEAQNLGIQIPETLISNDPQEIKEFLDPKWGPSVVKPLFGGDWTEDGSRIFTYTAGISISDLPSDDMIKACPCIYQRKIKKQFEARVAFFGAHTISVKLDSQRDKISELDWRVGDTRALNVEEISIPIALKEKCLLLMRRLGILHGSFDFAIDDEDNWIFFEVNEQGQFLWMETYVPHLPVLDTAIHFLMEPTVDFIYHPQASPVKMREICRLERFRSLIKMEKEIEKIYQNAESILL